MKKKITLEKHGEVSKDLLFWIKHYYAARFLNAKISKNKTVHNTSPTELTSEMLSPSVNTIHKVIEVVKKASKTISGVKVSYTTLKAFYEHIEEDKNIKGIKEIDQKYVENFILSVKSDEDNNTKARYYTHIKALFSFIQQFNTQESEGKSYIFNIGKDKAGNVKKILDLCEPRKLPVFLETNEMKKLNKSMVENPNYKNELDKAKQILIIRLLMIGCISTNELMQIKEKDFVEVEEEVGLIGLIVGDRIIHLPKQKFISYLETYKEHSWCKDGDYFFCNQRTKAHITNQAIGKIIGDQFRYAKIKKPKQTAEVLRNSGVIYLHRRGVSDKKIQTILGYKTLLSVHNILKAGVTDHLTPVELFDDIP